MQHYGRKQQVFNDFWYKHIINSKTCSWYFQNMKQHGFQQDSYTLNTLNLKKCTKNVKLNVFFILNPKILILICILFSI